MKAGPAKLTDYENKLIAKEPNFENRLKVMEREVKQLKTESMSTIEKVASLQLWQAEEVARLQEEGRGYVAHQQSNEKPKTKEFHIPTSFYAPDVHP